jgi:hypothetical protein
MADLVSRLDYDGRIRHVRDEAYFTWKFENPKSTYRFVYAGGNRLDGYLVLSANFGDTWVSIVDWQATDHQVLEQMLRAAYQWGSFGAAYTWHTTLPSEHIGVLQSVGFASSAEFTQHDGRILVKRLHPDGLAPDSWQIRGRALLSSDNWDLRMIMHDAF